MTAGRMEALSGPRTAERPSVIHTFHVLQLRDLVQRLAAIERHGLEFPESRAAVHPWVRSDARPPSSCSGTAIRGIQIAKSASGSKSFVPLLLSGKLGGRFTLAT